MATERTSPPPMGAALLSRQMYELACGFTSDMLTGKLRESGAFAPEMAFTLSVIILGQASLEAYINEFLAVLKQKDAQKWGALVLELERANISVKWALVAQLLAGKSFDKGAEPYQSFSLLLALRNALVHYYPAFLPMGTFPSPKLQSLSSKFRFAYPDKADWTVQVLNAECARWACGTVKAMIRRFHELVGGPDLTTMPPAWSDPP